jgi:alanine racemase
MGRVVTAVAVIDDGAFARNVSVLVERAAPAEVMLAVKADAYGHGMVALAPVALAAGARSLAVLEIPAALTLRESGIDCRLFAWLHGPRSDFAAAVAAHVDLGVSAEWQLEAIAAAAQPGTPARVHLKIDTGLRRNGALPEQWPTLVRAARALAAAGRIEIEGIWSHLADASVEADEAAIGVFEGAIATAASLGVTPPLRHLAASSAGWREPRARFDLVRFGIAAYGVSPFDDASGHDLGLGAVMTLRSTVLDAPAPSDRRWIAAGYADGVPVTARGAEVSIDGRRYSVEAVEVDRTLVAAPESIAAGAVVTIFGEPGSGVPSAEDWARWSGTIGDEILTGVPARVPRQGVGSPTVR